MSNGSNIIAAFTEEQTSRLTGVSMFQLRSWDETRFFVPSIVYGNRRTPYSRLYSFRDLASLKVLDQLRNQAMVPLKQLREVKQKLAHLGDDLWATTTLYVLHKKVVFQSPHHDFREEVVSGQEVLEIPLKLVTGGLEDAVRSMRGRDLGLVGQIDRKKTIAHNQPVIAGTRIPVRSIQAFAQAGYSVSRIRKEYPTLTDADIEAAIGYETAA